MSKWAVFVLLDILTVLSFFFNIKLTNFFSLRKPVDSHSQPLPEILLKIFNPLLFIHCPAMLMPLLPCNPDTGAVFSQDRHKAHGNVHMLELLQPFNLQVAPLTPIKTCHGAHCSWPLCPVLILLTEKNNLANNST